MLADRKDTLVDSGTFGKGVCGGVDGWVLVRSCVYGCVFVCVRGVSESTEVPTNISKYSCVAVWYQQTMHACMMMKVRGCKCRF